MNAIPCPGEWQPVRWLRTVGLAVTSLVLAGQGLLAQNAGDDIPTGPVARAADVRVAGQLAQDIHVTFDWRRSVDRESLGDGDLTVTGPLGYSQRARLVSVGEIFGVPPFPFDWEGNGEAPEPLPGIVPQPVRMVVATYRVFPSDTHDGPWSPEQNGPYAIYLNAGEVVTATGEFYPPALLGGFRVALGNGDPEPVLPDEVRITIGRDSVVAPDAAGVAGTAQNYHAQVELFFADRNVEVTDWGKVVRERNEFFVTVKAVRIPGGNGEAADGLVAPPRVFSHRYVLGELAPGDYRFVLRSQNQRIGLKEFRVEGGPVDDDAPVATLRVEPVTRAGDAWHDLRVIYEDESGVDPAMFGASDLRVFSAIRCELNAAGLCADSGRLPVVFVEAHPTSNDLKRFEALYRVGPPSGGWTKDANGFYTVLLEDGEVCDLLGNCNRLRTLGGFAVAIQDEPPVPAKATLRVNTSDPTNVTARVEVVIEGGYAITGQSLRRDGDRFILSATALPTPGVPPFDPDAPPVSHVEVLEYSLGALAPGSYVAVFVLNDRQLAAASFALNGDPPPLGTATIAVDATNPTRVVANVHVDFLGHFAIIGQSIRREGSTVYLLATAEEQPVIAIFPPPPPVPADLFYEIGALPPGVYKAVFVLNGRNLADQGFTVGQAPPVPATAQITVDTKDSGHVVASVTVQFGDHYRVVAQSIRREGNRFVLVAVPEGPLPLMAPLPPAPITLRYELGAVEPGLYSAAFVMREHVYAATPFKVEGMGEPPFAADVALTVDTSGAGVVLHAIVDFEDPYVVIVDQGTPRHEGNQFIINATAARANFFVEPDGAPVRLSYPLGALEAGAYAVVYRINGETEGRLEFKVDGPPRPPVPHVAFIEIHEGDAAHSAEVGIVLDRPDLRVLDWGEVRRDGSIFAVEIVVGPGDTPGDPAGEGDPNVAPDGFEADANGNVLVGGFPVRLVRHRYVLGVLDPGEYAFVVTSQGSSVARKGFVVRGMGPMAELRAEDITQGGAETHRFSVHYSDPDGLNHEALRGAAVTVSGPDGFHTLATLREYSRTEDVPSTGATAVYSIVAPGGKWDAGDNGRYRVSVDAGAVRDRLGNPLGNGALGSFDVRILPDVPGDPGAVAITTGMTATGEWGATVEVRAPGVTVTEWGRVTRNGNVFVAMAHASRLDPAGNTPGAPPETTHTYLLGSLAPGHYRFVFKTNLGQCGQAVIEVPGIPRDPVDDWIEREADGHPAADALAAFAFALRAAGGDSPRVEPEIFTGSDQRPHLGLRFRRLLGAIGIEYVLECSVDMRVWHEAGDSAELVAREIDLDGTETVHLCLRAAMADSPIRYLRVVARRTGG